MHINIAPRYANPRHISPIRLLIILTLLAALFSDPISVHAATIHQCGAIAVNHAWTAENIYVVDCGVTVYSGATLTIQAGTVVKFNTGGYFHIIGTLNAQGTAASPIIFTSYKDDTYSGDTNGDGSTTQPAPNDWSIIRIDGPGSNLQFVRFRYGGQALYLTATATVARNWFEDSYHAININGGNSTVTENEITHSSGTAIYVANSAPTIDGNNIHDNQRGIVWVDSAPVITNNIIINNTGFPLYNYGSSTPTVSGNTITGNGYEAVGVGGEINAETSWSPIQELPYWVESRLTINSVLHITAGTVIKSPYSVCYLDVITVNGVLDVQGLPASPVVFTSYRDDYYGGDTNGDRLNSAPEPGDWIGIKLANPDQSSTFRHTILRYAGYDGAIRIENGGVTLEDSVIELGSYWGIYITLHTTDPTITVRKNIFRFNQNTGIYIWSSETVNPPTENLTIENNSFVQNKWAGISSNIPVIAENNWWNASSGPYHYELNPDGRGDAVVANVDFTPWLTERPYPGREIDLKISLYRSVPAPEHDAYEKILCHFADAVYEMSEGQHRLNTITIYQNGEYPNYSNIKWIDRVRPYTRPSGIRLLGDPTARITFADFMTVFGGKNVLVPENHRLAGYTLAHEFGHYFYGLYDEYKESTFDPDKEWRSDYPHFFDDPPEYSIMNAQWEAAAEQTDYRWLNLSLPKYTHNGKRSTAQDRIYGASGLETVSRPIAQDPPNGYLYAFRPHRPEYPELASLKPSPADEPKINHVGSGCELQGDHLNIIWKEPQAAARAPAAEAGFDAILQTSPANAVRYPELLVVTARVFKHIPITRGNVSASYLSPDGASHPLVLKDDGVPPDAAAEDGLYTAILPYDRDGEYTIQANFNNDNGAAVYTELGYLHVALSSGEAYEETFPPVGEVFSASASLTVSVKDFKTDDHGDAASAATGLSPDNIALLGRIDRGRDVDWFRVWPTSSGLLAIRLHDLALGARPRLRIYDGDGTTLLKEFNVQPEGDDYFMTIHYGYEWGSFYLVVLDQNPSAAGGYYRISVGPLLNNTLEMSKVVNLPLVTR